MDRRVFVLFCLLTAVASQDPKPAIKHENKVVTCSGGTFSDGGTEIKLFNSDNSYIHTCTSECPEDQPDCDRKSANVLIKVLDSENLIQLNLKDVLMVLVSDVLVTALIGWAVYSICAQPVTRSSYQGNKASDRQVLINNHGPSGGDTYQRLNTRTDEYSTLHAQRKQKNKQSV